MDSISHLSFGESYSGIGFDATRSMHFEDLKRDQGLIKQRTLETIGKFADLRAREKKLEARKEAAQADGSSLWPSECAEEMSLSMEQTEFSQNRQDLIQYVRIWAQDASNQLAMFPGFNPDSRKKRALDFVNLQKRYLMKTTPLGEEEEEREEDDIFLKSRMTELPLAKEDSRMLRERLRSSRMDSKRKDRSPSAAAPLRTSTPSGPEKARNPKEDGDTNDTKSKLGPENQSKESLDGCKMIREKVNPSHECVYAKKGEIKGEDGEQGGGRKEEEEENVDEDTLDGSGPDYEKIKPEVEKGGSREERPLDPKKGEDMDHNEKWQTSIISKQLGRSLTEGTTKGDNYRLYKETFSKAQEEKREAEAEINRLHEQERELMARRQAEEEEERREKKRKEEEEREEKERRENLEKEDQEAIGRAMAELERIRGMNREKREMAKRRMEQIREEAEEERKEKERRRKSEGQGDMGSNEREGKGKKEGQIKSEMKAKKEEDAAAKREKTMEEREREKQKEKTEREKREKAKREQEEEDRKRGREMREQEERKEEERRKGEERKEEERNSGAKRTQKRRGPSTSSDDEGASSGEGDGWEKVVSKKRAKKSKKRNDETSPEDSDHSSSETSSTTSDSDSESEKGGRKSKKKTKTHRQLRHETMLKQRMKEARPRTEDEKFGGDEKTNYQNFKQRFESVTKVKGANALDVLSEFPFWLKGAPEKIAKAQIGSSNPKKALGEIWKQLDLYYASQVQTASERLKPIISKGRLNKDDIDGMIDFMSEMLAIQTQLRNSGMEKDLHRQDIVRDLMNKKLPFMSEDFYKEEIRRQKKNARFRMDFDDMLQALSDKIRTMKAQGVAPKKEDQAKIAAMQGNPTGWNRKVASPPKPRTQTSNATVECSNCHATYGMDKCNDLMDWPLEKVVEKLKAGRSCFNCLKPYHIAKFCRNEGFRCGKCGLNHPTILCGLRQLQQRQRLEREEGAGNSASASTSASASASTSASNNKGTGEKRSEGKGKGLASGSGHRGDNPVNLNNL